MTHEDREREDEDVFAAKLHREHVGGQLRTVLADRRLE